MERKIKIFKSFEEQEQYNLEQMHKTTPLERFRNLYRMQKLSRAFNPVIDKTRKIIIHRSTKDKDLFDIARLEEIRNKKLL